MNNKITLDSVLDQAEKLPINEQILLTNILRKRLVEEKRKNLINSVKESLQEYNSGLSHTGTIDKLFDELEDEK